MTTLTEIENPDFSIVWECESCKNKIPDRTNIEQKLKKCPFCNEPITNFEHIDWEYID